LDLGIVREVEIKGAEKGAEVTVFITPTYSGCPAMDVISIGIRMALMSHGLRKVNIELQLSPAWTTDWMTDEGKAKLKAYGIAPPNRKAFNPLGLFEEDKVSCPRCGSEETELVSQFEPFEHFKCH
jgi:ring-1,2-phenylacetyl-CoA epoxidase subunit PaaD